MFRIFNTIPAMTQVKSRIAPIPDKRYLDYVNSHSEKLVDTVARIKKCSLRQAKSMLDARRVFVNGRRVWMAKHPVMPGDQVEIHGHLPNQKKRQPPAQISILHDAIDTFVANKPPGLLSNGRNSAESCLRKQLQTDQIRCVHRLDKGTSGCLCMARSTQAFERMVTHFREHRVLKLYRALVAGQPPPQGTCHLKLDGQTAVTHWRVLEQTPIAALVQIKIETGRTHQIRRHFAHLGHPILGDFQYQTQRIDDQRIRSIARPMLHASVFEAPLHANGQTARVEAPLPSDFRSAMKSLNFCFDRQANQT